MSSSLLDTTIDNVLVGRGTERRFENRREVTRAQTSNIGKLRNPDCNREVIVDEVNYPTNLPGREPSTDTGRCLRQLDMSAPVYIGCRSTITIGF